MIYSKTEMYDLLMDYTYIEPETLDLILDVAGNSSQTYLKVLKHATGFNTFIELEEKGTKVEDMYNALDEDEEYEEEEEVIGYDS